MITCDQTTASTHQVLSPAKVGRKQCDVTEDNYSTHHQTMIPVKETKEPSKSSHLSRTTRETATSGKTRATGKSTPVKIMVQCSCVSNGLTLSPTFSISYYTSVSYAPITVMPRPLGLVVRLRRGLTPACPS